MAGASTLLENANGLVEGNMISAVSDDPIEVGEATVIDRGCRTPTRSRAGHSRHGSLSDRPARGRWRRVFAENGLDRGLSSQSVFMLTADLVGLLAIWRTVVDQPCEGRCGVPADPPHRLQLVLWSVRDECAPRCQM